MDLNIILLVLMGFMTIGMVVIAVVLVRRKTPTDDVMQGRVQALAEQLAHSQGELQKLLHERLDTVSERMGKSLESTATKTAKSIGEIETRLKVIDEAQKNIKDLSSEIVRRIYA